MTTAPASRTQAASRATAGAAPAVNPWVVTFAVTVGTLMGALDTSVVNVALPYIRANLGATITQVAWVSTGYIIALVIVMPLTAWLGATFGRKRVYMSCLALFTVSSFFCGNAHSLTMLVMFRILQGFGAGALQPTEQAILRETFPIEQQGTAMGLYGLAVMLGPAVGPTLGGWITDNYNWPWIFYINIPIGIGGLFLVNKFVHEPEYARRQHGRAGVDAVGITLLAVGLGCLQVVLEQGESDNWFQSGLILSMTILAIITLLLFIWWELRVERPAVDLRILKNASFTTGTFIGGILGVSLYASMFLLPLYMQELLGYPAVESGIVLMPRSVVMLFLMPIAGLLYNRLGPKLMIGTGLFIAGFAPFMMSHFTLESGYWDLFWPQVIQGVGFVLIFIALSTSALAGIEKRKMINATGLYNLVRQLGGSFGTAVFATMLDSQTNVNRAVLVNHINLYNPAFTQRLQMLRQAFMAQGSSAMDAQMKAYKMMDMQIDQQSAMMAFDHCFFLIGLLFFLCLPLVFLLKTAKRPAGQSEPVEL